MRSLIGLLSICVLFSCTSSNEKKHRVYKERITYYEQESAVDGKALFQANCASCHHLLKDATGPALRYIQEKYSVAWMHKFFTNRRELEKDMDYQRILNNDIKPDCMEFPSLTKAQVEALLNYVEGCNRGCTF